MIILTFATTVFAGGTELVMSVGESEILNLKNIVRVSTSTPEVIELVVTGGQELLINAKKSGFSVVNVWTSTGISTYRITVQENYRAIENELGRLIDNPNIKVTVNQKYVVLNGTAETSLDADRAVQYGKMYRENVINNLDVKVKYQVLLSIMVTEMSKDYENGYGFRWGSWVETENGVEFYDWQWAFMENGNRITRFPGNWNLGSMLDAMQKDGDAKILAAPSILTTSGKEASFLAGGEIPIPLSDGQGSVKVEWKEYGVKLKVTPTITKDFGVQLEVAPEVSTLDWSNAILINGDKLPAIATRKAATNLLFKEGSTLVIGGLLKKEDSVTAYKFPVLGDLPIIGPLFRSKQFEKGDTELLFFVTPKIIKEGMSVDPKSLTQPGNKGPFFNETPQPTK
jgi:pilus assembly protein CpaC